MIAQRIPPSAMLTVKKYGFALGALTPLLMPAAYWLGLRYGAPNMSTFLPLLVIFFVVPLLEYAVGRETVNPDALRDVPKLARDPYYRVLLWMGPRADPPALEDGTILRRPTPVLRVVSRL